MSDLFQTRRSVRRFKQNAIDGNTTRQLYEAARWAPSWGNQQCAEIIEIKNDETKAKLADLLSAKNPATKSVANAPLLLAICGRPTKSGYYKEKQVTRYGHWFLYDLGIVTQNICLKAHELGLGSVIIGSFDHKAAESLLAVEEGVELVSIVALGYPDHEPPAPKRRELTDFVHSESFGKKTGEV